MDKKPQQDENKRATRTAQKRVVNRIVMWVVGIVITLLVVIGIMGYRYIHSALEPLDSNNDDPIAVQIKIGSTTKQIGAALQRKGVIKSATVFSYYVKFHNVAAFNAGTYTFSKAQNLGDIVNILKGGGNENNAVGTVLVKEGVTVDDISKVVNKLTKKNKRFTRADFLKLMKDQTFFNTLEKKYPELLSSAKAAKGVRYRLEGYLYPATYDVGQTETLKELVTEMVAKSDSVMQSYYKSIKKQGYTVQQVLTLASLVEREGVTDADRRKIAGVFLNRIDAKMPLQSDISVMYALNTHKTHLTNKDTAVDSPYNLYVHTGYGPGPFDQPSEQSIEAVLNPADRSKGYYYFVANLKTGKILYAATLAEQTANTAEFASDNSSASK